MPIYTCLFACTRSSRAVRRQSADTARQTNRHLDQPANAETRRLNTIPGQIEIIELSHAFLRPGHVIVNDSLRGSLLCAFGPLPLHSVT